MMTWHAFMAASAFLWLSGVTPAQQAASTTVSTSGRKDLTSSTLEITQMSVHSPMNVAFSTPGRPCFFRSSSRAFSMAPRYRLPKPCLSMGVRPTAYAVSWGTISQPSVPQMQWGTGRFRPSWLSR